MVPLVVIKRNRILAKLKKAGAVSPQAAVTLEQAGVAKGDRNYPGLVAMMLREGDLLAAEEAGNQFYLGKKWN